MASVTKSDQGKEMADDDSHENERDDSAQSPEVVSYRSAAPGARGGGFFTIYKKGQGYWTRMGTVLAAAVIILMTADFVYSQMINVPYGKAANNDLLYLPKKVAVGGAIGFIVSACLVVWRIINKPSHVDFLIATDSEMKKVNWTTRKELVGSTKVVVFFVILIALILFGLDVVFGYFFQMIKVLEFGPFQ
jgi:preprotein translocase subunit SecE